MFDIGMGEFLGLAVVALLVLGPDKLPKFAADAARFISQLRKMANTARDDVRRELGPELQGISLEDLNPRTALRKHVLDDLDLDSDLDLDLDAKDARPKRARKSAAGQPGTWQPGTWEQGIWQPGTWQPGTWEPTDPGQPPVPPPYDPDTT